MKKDWRERKVLYVHGGKRFIAPDREIYGYDKDMLISLKERYSYLGNNVKFVQIGTSVSAEETENLICLKKYGVDVIPVKYFLSPKTRKNKSETKKRIYQAVKECDILIARMPSVIASIAQKAAIKYNKPYIVEVVGCAWDTSWNYNILTKLYAPWAMMRLRSNVVKARYVIYVSEHFLQHRYPNHHTTCAISNVILPKTSDDVMDSRLKRLSVGHKKIVITTLAAVDVAYKGQHFVIEALSKLTKKGYDFEYHIAGRGDNSRLNNLVHQFKVSDKVIFDGMLNSNEVYDLLDKTDIYVQPSVTEGLPRAVIEAMSRGCVVMGTKVGGIPELVGEDFIFKKGDVKEIMNRLMKLADNNELLVKNSVYNFNKAKEFDKVILENRRKEFYDKFIGDNF